MSVLFNTLDLDYQLTGVHNRQLWPFYKFFRDVKKRSGKDQLRQSAKYLFVYTAEEHQSLCFQKVLTAKNTVRLVKEEISSQISVVVNIPQYKRELINQNSSPIHFNNSSVTTHWHAL